MSSLNLTYLGRALRFAAVAGLALGLAACLRPLHGPTTSGANLQNVLASIDIPDFDWPDEQAVVGHYLRSELIFLLNGSGSDVPKKYNLKLSLRERLSTPIVDAITGLAQSATLTGDLRFTLTTVDGKQVVTWGTATAQATYDRFSQRFATVRAARDAEIRLAKTLADQVRTRLAATLSQM